MDNLSLQMGESGERPATPQELEDQLRVLEEKVQKDARDIVEVLRIDLPRFIQRTVKERFVASSAADELPEAKVKALKADVDATGKKAVADIVPGLESPAIWLGAEAPPVSDRHDLRGNAEVSGRLQRVGPMLKELFERNGFAVADEDFRDAYRLPTWFTEKGYPRSLVEGYWRDVEEYQRANSALKGLRDRDMKSKRSEKWDSA